MHSEFGAGSSVRRVAVLLPLLCVTGSVLSDQDNRYGRGSYPADPYAENPVYGSPYDAYGDRSSGLQGGDMFYPPGDSFDRSSDPYGDDPYRPRGGDSRYGQAGAGRNRSYPGAREETPYGRNGPVRFDHPRDGADGYAGGWGSEGGLPPAAARGYRFRGDRPVGDGTWSASGRRDGYRFRPLTEQELGRRDSASGWRPRELERSGERPGRRDPLPVEEAYGYESDSWFRRYYRRQP